MLNGWDEVLVLECSSKDSIFWLICPLNIVASVVDHLRWLWFYVTTIIIHYFSYFSQLNKDISHRAPCGHFSVTDIYLMMWNPWHFVSFMYSFSKSCVAMETALIVYKTYSFVIIGVCVYTPAQKKIHKICFELCIMQGNFRRVQKYNYVTGNGHNCSTLNVVQ